MVLAQSAQKFIFVLFRVISWIDLGVELKAIHELTRTNESNITWHSADLRDTANNSGCDFFNERPGSSGIRVEFPQYHCGKAHV